MLLQTLRLGTVLLAFAWLTAACGTPVVDPSETGDETGESSASTGDETGDLTVSDTDETGDDTSGVIDTPDETGDAGDTGETGDASDCPSGSACDDEDPCTVDDVCEDEVCAGTPVVCEGDADRPCLVFACDDTGLCAGSVAEGACLIDDVCVDAGAAPADNSCTSCQPELNGIGWSPVEAETACEDGDACTVADACDGHGVCAGEPMDCDDEEPCTADACVDGVCTHPAVDDSNPCDDGDPCTVEVSCASGDCIGVPMVCDDGDQCTVDACVDGECVFEPAAAGTACNDLDACTTEDVCSDGSCAGEPMACDDGDDCTMDACDEHLGDCKFDLIISETCAPPPADFSLQDLNPYSGTYLQTVTLGDFTGFLLVVAFHSAS